MSGPVGPYTPANPLDPQGILAALAALNPVPAQPDPSIQMTDDAGNPLPSPPINYATAQPTDPAQPNPGPEYAGDLQWLPFLEHQSFDPTLPNFAGKPPAAQPPGPAPAAQPFSGATPQQIAANVQMDNPQSAGPGAGTATQPQATQSQPFLPGSLDNPNIALANEGIAAHNEANAKTASDRDLAQRRVQADTDYATGLQKAQIDYQHQRAMAEASANQETQAWLQKYETMAAQEPNPHRWWDNESGLGKAVWLLGLAFSSAHAAITPGARDVALDMIQREIDQDVQLQKDRLQRSLAAMGTEGKLMQQRHQQNLTDLTDDHTMTLGRLQALHQTMLDKAAVPGDAQAAATMAQANTWLAGKVADTANARAAQTFRAKEAEANRTLQMNIAKLTDARERAIAAGHDVTELAGGTIRAGVATAAAQAKGQGDQVRISPAAGFVVMDDKTGKPLNGDGGLYVDKSMKPDQLATAEAGANQKLADLQKARDALANASTAQLMAGAVPELNAAMADLKLQESGGHLSHNSMGLINLYGQKIAGMSTGQGMGFKDNTEAALFRDQMLKVLDEGIHNHVAEVQNQFAPYLPKGAHLIYDPHSVEAPATPKPTAADQLAETGNYQPAQVYDTASFRAAKAGDHPLKYDTEAEQQAQAAFKGKSPATIDELVSHWTDPYDTTTYKNFPYKDAKTGTTRIAVLTAAEDAKSKAQAALDDLEGDLKSKLYYPFSTVGRELREAEDGDAKAKAALVRDIKDQGSKKYGLTDLTDDDVMKILKDTGFGQ